MLSNRQTYRVLGRLTPPTPCTTLSQDVQGHREGLGAAGVLRRRLRPGAEHQPADVQEGSGRPADRGDVLRSAHWYLKVVCAVCTAVFMHLHIGLIIGSIMFIGPLAAQTRFVVYIVRPDGYDCSYVWVPILISLIQDLLSASFGTGR